MEMYSPEESDFQVVGEAANALAIHQAHQRAEEETLLRDVSLRNSPAYRACWALYRYAAHQEKIPHELRGYLEREYENWDRIEASLLVLTTSPEGFKTMPPMQALAWLQEQNVTPHMLALVYQDLIQQGLPM